MKNNVQSIAITGYSIAADFTVLLLELDLDAAVGVVSFEHLVVVLPAFEANVRNGLFEPFDVARQTLGAQVLYGVGYEL